MVVVLSRVIVMILAAVIFGTSTSVRQALTKYVNKYLRTNLAASPHPSAAYALNRIMLAPAFAPLAILMLCTRQLHPTSPGARPRALHPRAYAYELTHP